jgi:DNA-directed RNA polymerase specialized sigma subunit
MAFVRFQWLKDYQELDEQILYLKWNLNKSKLELNRWVYGDLADVRIEKNSRSSMLEENIQKIENEIEILEEQRQEMLAIINSFKGIDNEIIRKKYVEGCSLEIIAEEIGYSASYLRQRHADIRKTLNFLDEYEMNKIDRQNKLNEIDYYNKGRDEAVQISLF